MNKYVREYQLGPVDNQLPDTIDSCKPCKLFFCKIFVTYLCQYSTYTQPVSCRSLVWGKPRTEPFSRVRSPVPSSRNKITVASSISNPHRPTIHVYLPPKNVIMIPIAHRPTPIPTLLLILFLRIKSCLCAASNFPQNHDP